MSEPAKWVVICEHCDYRYGPTTEEDAWDHWEEHARTTNHWVCQRKQDARERAVTPRNLN